MLCTVNNLVLFTVNNRVSPDIIIIFIAYNCTLGYTFFYKANLIPVALYLMHFLALYIVTHYKWVHIVQVKMW